MGSSARLSYAVKTHGERKQNVITTAVHRNRTVFVPRLGTVCRRSRGKSQKTVCSTVRDPTVLQRRRRRRFHTHGTKQQRPAVHLRRTSRPSSRRTAPFLRFGAHEKRTEPRSFSRREIPNAHTYNNGTVDAPRLYGNENTIDNTMT